MNVALSRELAEKTRPYHHMLHAKWTSAVTDRASLIDYLIQTYHYVVASVPLMEFAARAPLTQSDRRYHDYLLEHVEEEREHDLWLLEDLETLGVDREIVRSSTPLSPAMHMVGRAYYTIAHQHPIGLLGYIYALESAPPTDAFLADLARTCDVSLSALRTLREHGERDMGHRDELIEFIDGGTLDDRQRGLVVETSICTLRTAFQLFEMLVAERLAARAI